MKGAMQHQADTLRLGRVRVREFELAENLRLADHHRVEARADAEQMAYGVAPLETIERAGEQRGVDLAIGGKETYATSSIARAGSAATPMISTRLQVESSAASASAGALPFRRASAEAISPSRIGQPLADRDRGGAMIDARG